MPRLNSLVLAACLATGVSLPAQIAVYSFGSTTAPTTAATTASTWLTAGTFSSFTGSGATGTGAPLYTAGSGGAYFGASLWTGAAPGGNYFEFTLTPTEGHQLAVTGVTFGYRATASGPTSFVLRSSADGFGADLATASLVNDSTWHTYTSSPLDLAGLVSPTVFRLYAAGASSSLGTLRVDDVTVSGAVAAVPEPAAVAAMAGGIALAAGLWHRRRRAAPRARGQ